MSQPLAGKTVLVTRPRAQAAELAEPLRELGATVFLMPVIEIAPLENTRELDAALRRADTYDWIVFTSVNGVGAVELRVNALELIPEEIGRAKLAAIGPATAAAVARLFRQPDLVPSEYLAEAIGSAIENVGGKKFLLLRADIARPDLAEALKARGGIVDEVPAYRIQRSAGECDLPEAAPDYITLSSSAIALSLRDRLESLGKEEWLERSRLACIGPITAATVEGMGYRVEVMPTEYTVPALVQGIVQDAEALHV